MENRGEDGQREWKLWNGPNGLMALIGWLTSGLGLAQMASSVPAYNEHILFVPPFECSRGPSFA
jgi:hypothetical protein